MSSFYKEIENNVGINNFNQGEEQPKIEGIEPIPLGDNNIFHITEQNKKYQEKELEENEFISGFKKIFIYFFQRLDSLLEQKDNINFPNFTKCDFNSIIEFLTKVNNLSNKQFNNPPGYKIKHPKLRNLLRDFLYDINNDEKKFDDSAFAYLDDIIEGDLFKEEKYSPNDKNQNKNLINNKKLKKTRVILNLIRDQINPIIKNYQEFIDYLKNECKFTDNDLEPRGNFIIPNFNNNNFRGTEKYYPPYGYYGIGLQVCGKYEEDGDWILKKPESCEWANAYLSIFQENNSVKSSEDFKKKIYDLCFKNEGLKEFEKDPDFKDSRHWKMEMKNKNKKGVYLNYKFENAEKDASLIEINGKEYKILLMARVKIDEICQPKNKDIWFLDKDFIRIYRILFKKIK